MTMFSEATFWEKKLEDGWKVGSIWSGTNSLSFSGDKIVFCGMGGSGIAGTLLSTLFNQTTHYFSYTLDSPLLPQWIDHKSLVFIISYSGETWEMLALYDELLKRGCKSIVISHGGELLQRAQKDKLPSIFMPASETPRSALGLFLGMFLALFEHFKLLEGKRFFTDFLSCARQYLPRLQDKHEFEDFLTLAAQRDFFHILGVTGDSYACARRAATQFNENSKVQAVTSELPEAHHNLLAAFIHCAQKPLILLFFTDFLPEKLKKAILCFSHTVHEEGVALYKPPILGDTWGKQLFYIVVWSDFASYYLAEQQNVDATSVVLINRLKEKIDAILE